MLSRKRQKGPASLARHGQRLRVFLVLRHPVVMVDGKAFPLLFLAIGPDNRECADLAFLAQAEDVARVARRQVAATALGETPLRPPADLQADPGPDDVAVLVANYLEPEPVVAVGLGNVLQDADGLVDM